MKPLIGITSYRLERRAVKGYGDLPLTVTEANFVEAVQEAGGLPVILPEVDCAKEAEALVSRIDGLLMTGGDDVQPSLYNEAPHRKLGALDPDRDRSDWLYLDSVKKLDRPFLGICRGMQLINVHRGGSLYQDLSQYEDWQLQHRQASAPSVLTHQIALEADSQVARLYDTEELSVNSVHHQAIKVIGEGLTATAYSPDGLIEAIEGPNIIGLQWHPEVLGADHRVVFDWLVQASQGQD